MKNGEGDTCRVALVFTPTRVNCESRNTTIGSRERRRAEESRAAKRREREEEERARTNEGRAQRDTGWGRVVTRRGFEPGIHEGCAFRGEMKSGFVRRRESPQWNINFSEEPSTSSRRFRPFGRRHRRRRCRGLDTYRLAARSSRFESFRRLRRVCRPIGKFSKRKKLSNQRCFSESFFRMLQRERKNLSPGSG